MYIEKVSCKYHNRKKHMSTNEEYNETKNIIVNREFKTVTR